MKKELKDYLHLYLGCQIILPSGSIKTLTAIQSDSTLVVLRDKGARQGDWHPIDNCKPSLRPLSDMTEQEMTELILLTIPDETKDKPGADDHSIEMFYNDGGNMVDDDVAVGCNYSCICLEGQMAIRKDGSIHLFDESGEKEALYNMPKLYAYLLSKHFDIFGLIECGIASDETLIQNTGTSPTK